jgi:hypothetical protein
MVLKLLKCIGTTWRSCKTGLLVTTSRVSDSIDLGGT